MKILLLIGGVIAIAAMIFFVHDNKPTDKGNENSFEFVKNDIKSGAVLLDVRTPEEYAEGHIKEAVNLPLQSIQNGEKPTANNNETLYVYCRSGNRSAQAAAILRSSGYTVKDLGGMNAVAAMGGEIVGDCC